MFAASPAYSLSSPPSFSLKRYLQFCLCFSILISLCVCNPLSQTAARTSAQGSLSNNNKQTPASTAIPIPPPTNSGTSALDTSNLSNSGSGNSSVTLLSPEEHEQKSKENELTHQKIQANMADTLENDSDANLASSKSEDASSKSEGALAESKGASPMKAKSQKGLFSSMFGRPMAFFKAIFSPLPKMATDSRFYTVLGTTMLYAFVFKYLVPAAFSESYFLQFFNALFYAYNVNLLLQLHRQFRSFKDSDLASKDKNEWKDKFFKIGSTGPVAVYFYLLQNAARAVPRGMALYGDEFMWSLVATEIIGSILLAVVGALVDNANSVWSSVGLGALVVPPIILLVVDLLFKTVYGEHFHPIQSLDELSKKNVFHDGVEKSDETKTGDGSTVSPTVETVDPQSSQDTDGIKNGGIENVNSSSGELEAKKGDSSASKVSTPRVYDPESNAFFRIASRFKRFVENFWDWLLKLLRIRKKTPAPDAGGSTGGDGGKGSSKDSNSTGGNSGKGSSKDSNSTGGNSGEGSSKDSNSTGNNGSPNGPQNPTADSSGSSKLNPTPDATPDVLKDQTSVIPPKGGPHDPLVDPAAETLKNTGATLTSGAAPTKEITPPSGASPTKKVTFASEASPTKSPTPTSEKSSQSPSGSTNPSPGQTPKGSTRV